MCPFKSKQTQTPHHSGQSNFLHLRQLEWWGATSVLVFRNIAYNINFKLGYVIVIILKTQVSSTEICRPKTVQMPTIPQCKVLHFKDAELASKQLCICQWSSQMAPGFTFDSFVGKLHFAESRCSFTTFSNIHFKNSKWLIHIVSVCFLSTWETDKKVFPHKVA